MAKKETRRQNQHLAARTAADFLLRLGRWDKDPFLGLTWMRILPGVSRTSTGTTVLAMIDSEALNSDSCSSVSNFESNLLSKAISIFSFHHR